jgi:hypothetical protein
LRLLTRITPLLLLIFFLASGPSAKAQDISAYFGLGTAQVGSNGQQIDTFGDGTLYNTSGMGGIFAVLGGDFMFKHWLGFGAEYSTRFTQANYAGLTFRPTFYDFNAILHPFPFPRSTRIVPELQAGLGGASYQFYYNQSACDAFAGCSSSSEYIESSNHFQLHGAAAVRIYVTSHIFVKPQVDIRWVNNNYQFGSSWVPEGSISIGISSGDHK